MNQELNHGYTSDFLLAMLMGFFKSVASPAHRKNCMYSHPRTGDATSLYFEAKSSAR